VTVPTKTVKQDVIEIFGVSENKIHVIPWGVRSDLAKMDTLTASSLVMSWFGIQRPYALFVGNIEPKKNIPRLIEATKRASIPLVMAGPSTWGSRHRRACFRRKQGRVRYLGYVAPTELAALYSAAEVFIFPSHSEGFGLPVIEAMACGAPVVTSDAPSLLEISGDAALHASSTDIEAICDAITRIVSNTTLRADLILRGTRRANQFSTVKSALSFWNVVQTVA
jgi:glycosyltransferase involved in cell wall biosynthesis